MRIYIPSIYRTKNIRGKEYFCKRLAKVFEEMGICLVRSKEEKHDITLQAGLITEREKSKVVLRLDGVYNNIDIKYNVLNNRIKKSIHYSDALIYQSKFSKIMCEKYLGRFNSLSTIIFNGFDSSQYKKVIPLKSEYRYNFLTASRWRPHKRLKDIIKCFKLADIKDSCLYIAGDISDCGISNKKINKYISENNHIIFLGRLNQKKLSSYIKMCDCFIHLCWMESCPNGVVEAIAANKTVITNNIGGTREIVEPSGGIICEIDKKYDLEPCRLYSPPKINCKIIAEAMKNALLKKIKIKNNHLDIQHIAREYVSFFERVLK